MASRPAPWIRDLDYWRFLEMVPELPDTFEAWLTRLNQMLLEGHVRGGTVKVTVSPAHFEAYLREQGRPASEQELWQCVERRRGSPVAPARPKPDPKPQEPVPDQG